jgi:hypothetical protein
LPFSSIIGFLYGIDPAIAERFVRGLGAGDGRDAGLFFVETEPELDTAEDLCRFIGQDAELKRWRHWVAEIQRTQPALRTWIEQQPLKVLAEAEHWPRLLAVIDFFQRHPHPACYLRQLEIPGVDTKFIESRKPLLRELLDATLPDSAITLAGHPESIPSGQFERRYGLRHDEPLVRFRMLDPDLRVYASFSDLAVPLTDFRNAPIECSRIFVTENKINGLSFPPFPDSLVIFGLGYGVTMLKGIEWLQGKNIFYWGDIDTHGFAILSRLRAFLPTAQSFLMDRETLMSARSAWGQEPDAFRYTGHLERLTSDERSLYEDLLADRLGPAVRLEQERIPFDRVRERLHALG